MTSTISKAVIRMCNRIWSACPWAAPEGWAPTTFEQFMKDAFENAKKEEGGRQ